MKYFLNLPLLSLFAFLCFSSCGDDGSSGSTNGNTNVTEPISSISLSSNSETYFIGDEVEFFVTGNNGGLANQSSITVVGGSELAKHIQHS